MAGEHRYSSSLFIQSGSVAQFKNGITASSLNIEGSVTADKYLLSDGTVAGNAKVFFAGRPEGVSSSPPFSQDNFVSLINDNQDPNDSNKVAINTIFIQATGSATFKPNFFNFIKLGNDETTAVLDGSTTLATTVQQGGLNSSSYNPSSSAERQVGVHRYLIFAAETGSGGQTHQEFHTVTIDAFSNIPPTIISPGNIHVSLSMEHNLNSGSLILHFTNSFDQNQIDDGPSVDFLNTFKVARESNDPTLSGLNDPTDAFKLFLNHDDKEEEIGGDNASFTITANNISPGLSSSAGAPQLHFTASIKNYQSVISVGEFDKANTIASSVIQNQDFEITLEDTQTDLAFNAGTTTGTVTIAVIPPPTASIENIKVRFEGSDNEGGFSNIPSDAHNHVLLYDRGSTLTSKSISELDDRYTSSLVRMRVTSDITPPIGYTKTGSNYDTRVQIHQTTDSNDISTSDPTFNTFKFKSTEQTASYTGSNGTDFNSIEENENITTESNGFTSFEIIPNFVGEGTVAQQFYGTVNVDSSTDNLNRIDEVQHGRHNHFKVLDVENAIVLGINKCPDILVKKAKVEIQKGSKYWEQDIGESSINTSILYGLSQTLLSSQTESQIIEPLGVAADTHPQILTAQGFNAGNYITESIIRLRVSANIIEPFGPDHTSIRAKLSDDTNTNQHLFIFNTSSDADVISSNFGYTTNHGYGTFGAGNNLDYVNKELLTGSYTSSWVEFPFTPGEYTFTVDFSRDDEDSNKTGIDIIDEPKIAELLLTPTANTDLENLNYQVETFGYSKVLTNTSSRDVLYGDYHHTNKTSASKSWENHSLAETYASHSVTRFKVSGKIIEPFGPGRSRVELTPSIVNQLSTGVENLLDVNLQTIEIPTINKTNNINNDPLINYDSNQLVTEFTSSFYGVKLDLNPSEYGVSQTYKIGSSSYNYTGPKTKEPDFFSEDNTLDPNPTTQSAQLTVRDTLKTQITNIFYETETFGYANVGDDSLETVTNESDRTVLYGFPHHTTADSSSFENHPTASIYASHSIARFRVRAKITEPIGYLHTASRFEEVWKNNIDNEEFKNTLHFETGSSITNLTSIQNSSSGYDVRNRLTSSYTSSWIGKQLSSSINSPKIWTYTSESILHEPEGENSFTTESGRSTILTINDTAPTQISHTAYETETYGYSNEPNLEEFPGAYSLTFIGKRTVLYGDPHITNENSSSTNWFDHERADAYASQSVSRFRVKTRITEPLGPLHYTSSLVKQWSSSYQNVNSGSYLFHTASQTSIISKSYDSQKRLVVEYTSSFEGKQLETLGTKTQYKHQGSFTHEPKGENSSSFIGQDIITYIDVYDTPKTEIVVNKIETETKGGSGIGHQQPHSSPFFIDSNSPTVLTTPHPSNAITASGGSTMIQANGALLNSQIQVGDAIRISSASIDFDSTVASVNFNFLQMSDAYIGTTGQEFYATASKLNDPTYTYVMYFEHDSISRSLASGFSTTQTTPVFGDFNDTLVSRFRTLVHIKEPVGHLHHATKLQFPFKYSQKIHDNDENTIGALQNVSGNPSDILSPLITFTTNSNDTILPFFDKGILNFGYNEHNQLTASYTSSFSGSELTPTDTGEEPDKTYWEGTYDDSSAVKLHSPDGENGFTFTTIAKDTIFAENGAVIEEGHTHKIKLQVNSSLSNILRPQITKLRLEVETISGSNVGSFERTVTIPHGNSATLIDQAVNNTYVLGSSGSLVSVRVLADIEETPGPNHLETKLEIGGYSIDSDGNNTKIITFATDSSDVASYNFTNSTLTEGAITKYTSSFFTIGLSASAQTVPPNTFNAETKDFTISASVISYNDISTNGIGFDISTNSTLTSSIIHVTGALSSSIDVKLNTSSLNLSSSVFADGEEPSIYFVYHPNFPNSDVFESPTIEEIKFSPTIKVTPPTSASNDEGLLPITSESNLTFPNNLDIKHSIVRSKTFLGWFGTSFTNTTSNPPNGTASIKLREEFSNYGLNTLTNVEKITLTSVVDDLSIGDGQGEDTLIISIIPAQPPTMSGHLTGSGMIFNFNNNRLYRGALPSHSFNHYKEGEAPNNPNTFVNVSNILITSKSDGTGNDYSMSFHTPKSNTGNYASFNTAFGFGDSGSLKIKLNGTNVVEYNLQSSFNPALKHGPQDMSQYPGSGTASFGAPYENKGKFILHSVTPFNGVSQSLFVGNEFFPNGFQVFNASIFLDEKIRDGYNVLEVSHSKFEGSNINSFSMEKFEWYYDDGLHQPDFYCNPGTPTHENFTKRALSWNPYLNTPATFSLSGVSYFMKDKDFLFNLERYADYYYNIDEYNNQPEVMFHGITGIGHKTYRTQPGDVARTLRVGTDYTITTGSTGNFNELKHKLANIEDKNGLIFSSRTSFPLEFDKDLIPSSSTTASIKGLIINCNGGVDFDLRDTFQNSIISQANFNGGDYHLYKGVLKEIQFNLPHRQLDSNNNWDEDAVSITLPIGRFIDTSSINTGHTGQFNTGSIHQENFHTEDFRWPSSSFADDDLIELQVDYEFIYLSNIYNHFDSTAPRTLATIGEEMFQSVLGALIPAKFYTVATPQFTNYKNDQVGESDLNLTTPSNYKVFLPNRSNFEPSISATNSQYQGACYCRAFKLPGPITGTISTFKIKIVGNFGANGLSQRNVFDMSTPINGGDDAFILDSIPGNNTGKGLKVEIRLPGPINPNGLQSSDQPGTGWGVLSGGNDFANATLASGQTLNGWKACVQADFVNGTGDSDLLIPFTQRTNTTTLSDLDPEYYNTVTYNVELGNTNLVNSGGVVLIRLTHLHQNTNYLQMNPYFRSIEILRDE